MDAPQINFADIMKLHGYRVAVILEFPVSKVSSSHATPDNLICLQSWRQKRQLDQPLEKAPEMPSPTEDH